MTENEILEQDAMVIENIFTAINNQNFNEAKGLASNLLLKCPNLEGIHSLRAFCVNAMATLPNKENATGDASLKERLERLLNAKNYKAALDVLDIKEVELPMVKDAVLLNTEHLLKMRQYEEIIKQLGALIDNPATSSLVKAESYKRRGLCYLLTTNKVYARTEYTAYLKGLLQINSDPLTKADICRLLKDFDKAMELYSQAETKLNFDTVTIGRANCFRARKKDFEADNTLHLGIDKMASYIKENPLFEELYAVRSNLYIWLKKFDMALSDATRALALSASHIYYENRARIHIKMGALGSALEDMQTANKATFYSIPDYLILQAKIYAELLNIEEAINTYNKALHAAYDDDFCRYQIYTALANIHRKLNNEAKAEEYFKKARAEENFKVLFNRYEKELERLL